MVLTENTFPSAMLLAVGLALATLAPHALATPAVVECTVVLDQDSGAALVRTGNCEKRFTPMSTFKLPLALIGYDSGILKDARNPRWDYDPRFDAPKRARKAVDPTIWEEDSILWYSQELTRKLGSPAFDDYIDRLGYGNADTSGGLGRTDGLTHSWLSSSLLISADEQARLMRSIVARDLPVRRAAIDMTIAITPAFTSEEGWAVQGKTGSGWLRNRNGKFDRSRPVGWFVGWAEKDGRRIAFARLKVGNERLSEPSGLKLRAEFLKDLPALMRDR